MRRILLCLGLIAGELRFETGDGVVLSPSLHYVANAHAGTLQKPVLLRPADDPQSYKIIENDHVIIIRNNEKYDVTGKKL